LIPPLSLPSLVDTKRKDYPVCRPSKKQKARRRRESSGDLRQISKARVAMLRERARQSLVDTGTSTMPNSDTTNPREP
jgi:hypothetical protein